MLEPPVSCSDSELTLTLSIITDNFPEETFWTLTNTCTPDWTRSREEGFYKNSGAQYVDRYCVPDAADNFTIEDGYGDDICCQEGYGSYSVTIGANNTVASGNEFTFSETKLFGLCV